MGSRNDFVPRFSPVLNLFSVVMALHVSGMLSGNVPWHCQEISQGPFQIDPSTDETFYGITVAAYSVGSIISSPIFGYMNSRWRKVRPVVALGVLWSIAGNITFMFAEASDTNRKWIILCARIMTGAGRGMAILRKTDESDRPVVGF